MTWEQQELVLAIDCQKQIVASMPGNTAEQLVLDALYTALRQTFYAVNPASPQYVLSSSGAVLKRV